MVWITAAVEEASFVARTGTAQLAHFPQTPPPAATHHHYSSPEKQHLPAGTRSALPGAASGPPMRGLAG